MWPRRPFITASAVPWVCRGPAQLYKISGSPVPRICLCAISRLRLCTHPMRVTHGVWIARSVLSASVYECKYVTLYDGFRQPVPRCHGRYDCQKFICCDPGVLDPGEQFVLFFLDC
jgi:hypothetical protein